MKESKGWAPKPETATRRAHTRFLSDQVRSSRTTRILGSLPPGHAENNRFPGQCVGFSVQAVLAKSDKFCGDWGVGLKVAGFIFSKLVGGVLQLRALGGLGLVHNLQRLANV